MIYALCQLVTHSKLLKLLSNEKCFTSSWDYYDDSKWGNFGVNNLFEFDRVIYDPVYVKLKTM